MEVDGSGAGPASGGSGVHHRSLPVTSAVVMGRPAAAPARG
jgi:hypothetical protein